MLAHIHLAEALEEGQDGQVQPLAGALCIPLLVQACVDDGQQPKHTGPQVTIQQLLQSSRPLCWCFRDAERWVQAVRWLRKQCKHAQAEIGPLELRAAV